MESELEKLKIRVANLEAERGRLEDLLIQLTDELSGARLGRHHKTLLADLRLRLYQRNFDKPTPLTTQEQISKLVEQKGERRLSRDKRSRLFDW